MTAFQYDEAFSRNIGWVTAEEQCVLRTKRVAIAGLGGVGGGHLLTLTRLGIGGFHLADFDTFDLANFNRQASAATSTLGQRSWRSCPSRRGASTQHSKSRTLPRCVTADNLGRGVWMHGLRAQFERRPDSPDTRPIFLWG